MKNYIAKNLKEIILSLSIALIAVACFIIFKTMGIIALICPVHYLNPWQYFFYCQMFYLLIDLVIAIPVFLIAFVIIKKFARRKSGS
ncbi:MAG TPA: hypothetical protein VJ461_02695 [Candidatus Nanoarchaeia archaeon]|nr:hypothetical protein [Candidatus Nanoarchaeia archaeon]